MCTTREIRRGAPSVEEFNKRFKNDKVAMDYLIPYVFPGGKLVCPYCGCTKQIYVEKHYPSIFDCFNCGRASTILGGTAFESLMPHPKEWLYMIYLMFVARKSISTMEIERHINHKQDTLIKIRRRIQLAMSNYDLEPFSGTVEMDEAFLAGSNHGRYCKEGMNKGQKKYPIFGIFEAETHRAYTCIAMPNEKGKCLTGEQIKNFVEATVKPGATIVSDDFKSYSFLDKPDSKYGHEVVNHSEYEYMNENGFTTTPLEGFWAMVKKNYYGIHYNFSKRWSHLYLSEIMFRWQYADDWEKYLDNLLSQCVLFPRVIDVRKVGQFGNKTYDLKKYRMVLPECFDNVDLNDITVNDILNCEEPVYGILRTPYQSFRQSKCGKGNYPECWKKLGMVEYGIGYKDYRKNIVNTYEDVENMIKDATKYKDVNNKSKLREYDANCRPKSKERENTMRRKRMMKRRYEGLPKLLQKQIMSEYPKLLTLTDKEQTWGIYMRMRVLGNWYKKNKSVFEL